MRGRNQHLQIAIAVFSLAIFMSGCGGGSTVQQPPPPPSNPIPSITSISPSSANVGSQQQALTIQGSNFLSSSTVTYNGQARPATFLSSTQLGIALTADDQSAAGTYPIVASNPAPGGGASNSVNFTVNNPQPALGSMFPSVLATGSRDTAIGVSGSSFVATSVVRLNGAPLPTSFVSSSKLNAVVPTSALSASSLQPVTVTNPAPGGGTSSAANLAVIAPPPVDTVGPIIESMPPSAALVGRLIHYQVIATSADLSSLVFSLSTAPPGMTIDAVTGLM